MSCTSLSRGFDEDGNVLQRSVLFLADSSWLPPERRKEELPPERRKEELPPERRKEVPSPNMMSTSAITIPANRCQMSATSLHMSRSAPARSSVKVTGGQQSPVCRFPKLEECAHFHYERVRLGGLLVEVIPNDSDDSKHTKADGWVCLSVRSHVNDTGEECPTEQTTSSFCWQINRSVDNFIMLDEMLHMCIYDRKVSGLPDLRCRLQPAGAFEDSSYISLIKDYMHHLSIVADDTINCASILNWLQMDNKGHCLLVSEEDSSSINTPAVAAAYSVRPYVSQARDEISFEVGDMISIIDMPGPEESVWWRGKCGFKVGFFPQHCVAVIGDKVPRNMSKPPPIVGSVAVTPIKPVLRKHGKLISLFRSFILSRPSRRSLKLNGILRERVFGCDLGEHLANSGCDVPVVLSSCSKLLETAGLSLDGVYRLSGAATLVNKLRRAFDEPSAVPPPELNTPEVWADVHAVASLLKLYFRELPNPLCTYQLYNQFVIAIKLNTFEARLSKMKETVLYLPPPHYRTLAYLMRHLLKMSTLHPKTGMTCTNLAIVWSPNLLRAPDSNHALHGVAIQAVITEFLICYAEEIFSSENRLPDGLTAAVETRSEPVCNGKRPKSLPLSRSPTKLLSLEEARIRNTIIPSVPSSALLVDTNVEMVQPQRYIQVGSDSLPQYHTVLDLPGNKRGLKRSPSGWRGLFFRNKDERQSKRNPRRAGTAGCAEPGSSVSARTDIGLQTEPSDVCRQLADITSVPISSGALLRPVKSCESLGSEVCDTLPPMSHITNAGNTKQHTRSASCDSYFECWQGELKSMRLRLLPQERDNCIFSEDESTFQQQGGSAISSPGVSEQLASVEPSPSRPDSTHRKRSKLEDEEQLQYIDADTPKHKVSPESYDAKRVCKESCNNSTDSLQSTSPVVKRRERQSPRKSRSARYSNLHLDPVHENQQQQCVDRVTWHGGGQTLIQINWPNCDTPVSPSYDRLTDTDQSDNKHTIKICHEKTDTDSPESSVNISYHNLNSSERDYENLKNMTASQESSTLSNISPMKPSDELYECYTFSRPNFIDLCSEEAKSQQSPIKSTISITFKSPNKVLETDLDCPPEDNGRANSYYENIELKSDCDSLRMENASIPVVEASLPCQEACQPVDHVSFDTDVYSQVKEFRRSVDEVNALLEKKKPDTKSFYENVEFEPDKVERTTVRELANKFESPTEPKSVVDKFQFKYSTVDRSKSTRQRKDLKLSTFDISSSFYDLANSGSQSLDENAFLKEFSDTKHSKAEPTTPVTENPISLIQEKVRCVDAEPLSLDYDRKMSRERIEKYKEERREKLREKYATYSNASKFTKVTDPKPQKLNKETVVLENPVELRNPSRTELIGNFERRNTFELGQRLKYNFRSSGQEFSKKDRNSLPGKCGGNRSPTLSIKDMTALFEGKARGQRD